jgi:hypothetical protein
MIITIVSIFPVVGPNLNPIRYLRCQPISPFQRLRFSIIPRSSWCMANPVMPTIVVTRLAALDTLRVALNSIHQPPATGPYRIQWGQSRSGVAAYRSQLTRTLVLTRILAGQWLGAISWCLYAPCSSGWDLFRNWPSWRRC